MLDVLAGVDSVVGFVYPVSATNPPVYGQIDFTLIDEVNNVWSVLGSLARFNNPDIVNVQGTWQGAGFPVDAIRIANQNDDAMGAGLIACKYWG